MAQQQHQIVRYLAANLNLPNFENVWLNFLNHFYLLVRRFVCRFLFILAHQSAQRPTSPRHLGDRNTIDLHITLIIRIFKYIKSNLNFQWQTRWSGNPKGIPGPLKGGVLLEYLSTRLNFTLKIYIHIHLTSIGTWMKFHPLTEQVRNGPSDGIKTDTNGKRTWSL